MVTGRLARPQGAYLFPGLCDAKPVTREAIFKALRKAARAAGITKKVYPHLMRHAFATHLLQNPSATRDHVGRAAQGIRPRVRVRQHLFRDVDLARWPAGEIVHRRVLNECLPCVAKRPIAWHGHRLNGDLAETRSPAAPRGPLLPGPLPRGARITSNRRSAMFRMPRAGIAADGVIHRCANALLRRDSDFSHPLSHRLGSESRHPLVMATPLRVGKLHRLRRAL